uniref:Capsid protein n=1 Tax=Cressdnaviricota sp. TaxID=2748378 RepID=A0A6M3YPD1_9VIRU|nr:MAG: capsid protein [Cressdnaviricota sp.]
MQWNYDDFVRTGREYAPGNTYPDYHPVIAFEQWLDDQKLQGDIPAVQHRPAGDEPHASTKGDPSGADVLENIGKPDVTGPFQPNSQELLLQSLCQQIQTLSLTSTQPSMTTTPSLRATAPVSNAFESIESSGPSFPTSTWEWPVLPKEATSTQWETPMDQLPPVQWTNVATVQQPNGSHSGNPFPSTSNQPWKLPSSPPPRAQPCTAGNLLPGYAMQTLHPVTSHTMAPSSWSVMPRHSLPLESASTSWRQSMCPSRIKLDTNLLTYLQQELMDLD